MLPAVIQNLVDWLRRGYPHGVPREDYIPLIALLGRHLSPEETADVVGALLGGDQAPSADDVRAAIEEVTRSPALESDVTRVGDHLRAIEAAEAGLTGEDR